jgi:hypothetical protein
MKTLLIASTLIVTACGTSAPNPPETPAAGPDLAAPWSSACFDQGNGTHAKLEFDITAATWKLDYRVNGDAACSVPLATVHIEGPYAIERPSGAVPGAYEARFGFAQKTLTAHAQAIADNLDEAGCGDGAWKVGVAQSVLEKGCAAFGQYPAASCPADYDLVRRDGTKLSFGKRPADNDMCTPAKRPTELSPLALTSPK